MSRCGILYVIMLCFVSGMTLVAMACGSPLEEGVLEQVEYLINEKGADCTIPDVHGNTPVSKATQSSISMATLQ